MQDEWNIPDNSILDNKIRLVPMELLLLDWVLCTGSSFLQSSLDELVEQWSNIRARVWDVYFNPEHNDQPLGSMLSLSGFETKVLLAAVPTTYTWGDGIDYGLSLKTKLACLVLGTYIDPVLTAVQDEKDQIFEESKIKAQSKLDTARASLKVAQQTSDLSNSEMEQKIEEARDSCVNIINAIKGEVIEYTVKKEDAVLNLKTAVLEAEDYGIDTSDDSADESAN